MTLQEYIDLWLKNSKDQEDFEYERLQIEAPEFFRKEEKKEEKKEKVIIIDI